MSLASKRTARRAVLTIGSLCVALVLSVISCSDSGITEPTNRLSPSPLSASVSASLALATRIVYLGAPNSQPINFIRARVYDGSGASIGTMDQNLDPSQSSFSFQLPVSLPGAQATVARMTLELANHVGGGEVVQYSGRVANINLSPGDFRQVDIDLYPGPLDNLDVKGVHIVRPIKDEVEGDSTVATATLDGGTPNSRIFWSSLDPSIATVDNSGLIHAKLPGTAHIVAAVGTVADTAPALVTAKPASIVISPSPLTLTKVGDIGTYTASVLDARGTAIPNQHFTWSVADAVIATQVNGGTFQGIRAGQTTVTVHSVETPALSASAPLIVKALQPGLVRLEITPADVTLRRIGATQTYAVIGRDSAGNVMPTTSVTWTSSSETVGTIAGGVATAVHAGVTTITARQDTLSATATLRVVPNATALQSVSGNNQQGVAGATAAQPLVVRVVDAQGNPVGGVSVAFSADGTRASVSPAAATSDTNGLARAQWNFATVPGMQHATASVDSLTGSPVQFTAVVSAAGASSLALATAPSDSVATRAVLPRQPVVVMRDQFGNTVARAGVVVHAVAGSGITVSNASATTDTLGRATFASLTLGGPVGVTTLTFTADNTSSVQANVVLLAGAPAAITPVGTSSYTGTAGAALGSTPSVRVTDADGNPVAGAIVSCSVASGGGSIVNATATTNANGVASCGAWTLGGVAGTNTLTFSIGTLNTTVTATAAAGSAARYVVTSSGTSIVDGATTTITAQLVDANGNAIHTSGVVVNWSSTNGGSFSAASSTTDANGLATITFTASKIAGTVHTVRATDASNATGTSGNITVVVGPAVKLQTLLSGESAAPGTATGKTGTPASVSAGSAVTATVDAVDANWNVVTSATPTIAITSSDNAATLPASAALVGGTKSFSVTLKTAGSQTITAADQASTGALTSGASTAITVGLGAASASTTTMSVASSVASGASTTVTVTVRDAAGNVLTSATPSELAAASSGTLGVFSCSNGVCTATYTAPATGGSAIISVKMGGSDVSGSPATVTISAGAGAKYTVTPASTSVTDGGTTTITAQLVDASNNAVATAGKVITWSSTNGGSFSSGTSTTDANGQATVAFTTSKVAGTVHTVTGTDASSLTGTSGNITTVVGPALKLQVLLPGETAAPGTTAGKTGTPSAVTAGSVVAATVNAVDANWNVVAAAAPTIAISSTDGGASLPANAALASGTKSFNVALKTAGAQTITGTDQASTGALTAGTSGSVTVAAGPVSASTSTLVLPTSLGVGGTTTATVTEKDAYGNIVTTAAAGDFAATVSTGTLGTFACNNGVCTATYTAPASASTATITVKIGGANIAASPASVTIAAGAATKYTVTPSATSVADGGTTTITAQLVDGNNNSVATAGKVITWSSTNGGSFSAPTSTTDANGQATVTFTVSKTAGTIHTVTATDAGNLTGTTGNITTTVGAFAKLQLLVPGEAAAAGTTTGKSGTPSGATAANAFNVTVNAVDANWNVVSSVTDNVAITSSDATAVLPSNAALVAGTKTFSVTLKTAGTQTVTASDASDNTKSASTSPSITVSIGTASAATSTVSVGSSSLSTSGATTITVTVKDAAGNVITNATSSAFTLSASAGTIGTVTCTNGVCTATYTAPSSAGTPSITATIGGANIVNSVVAMTVTAVAPTAAKYSATTSSSSPAAGSGVTITAQLADASGTAVTTPGKVVTWSSTNGGSFSSPTSTTDATGQASVTFTTSKVAGTVHTVTATDAGSLTGTTGNITTVAGAAAKLQVLLPGETAAAGTIAGKTGTPSSMTAGAVVSATVNAVDANWNIVTTATPTLAIASTDGSAALPSNAALVAGTKSFSVTLKTAGAQTITGTDQASSGALTAGTSASIAVNPGSVSPSNSTLSVASPVAVSGTTTATVTLKDAYGNVVTTGAAGDFTATASSGSLGSFSCANGVCTATYTAPSSSGSATINVKIGGGDISGSPATVSISAGAGAKYTVTPAASSVTDGGTTVVTAQLVDASNNAVTASGKVITWSSTNGGTFSSPTSTTDNNGQATVTFTVSKVAGTVHTVTATDAGSLTGASGNITAVVGAATKLQVLLPGEAAAAGTSTGKTGTPTAVTAGNAVSATVTAVDANWNVVATATPTVAITSTDASAALPSNAALVNGTKSFSVTLKTAGSQTITGTDQASAGALASNTSATITVGAGAVSATTSTLSASSPVAVNGTGTVSVTLKDAYGNTVTTGAATAFAATASSGSLGTFSCTSGVCTATYSAPASSGSATIDVKIGGADISGSPATVTISAGGAAKYIVTPTATSVTDGGSTTITAQLADASNNTVATSGKVITWSSSNGGSFSAPTSTTDASGQATVTFTVSKVAGTVHTVTAADAGSLTGTSGNITATVGAFAKLQLLVPGEGAAAGTTTGKTGTPSGATAASAFNVTVNAVDANWNVVSAATDNVTLTSTDGSATLPVSTALVSGTKSLSVTLNTVGTQTVTASDATDNTKTANTSPSITVSAGAPSAATSTVSVGASTLTVNGTTTITVTVKDAAGNIVTTATSSSVTLSASGGAIGTVSCTNGVCTATYTAPSSAGTPTISAKIGSSNIVNSPVAMTINAAALTPAKYTVTSSSSSPVAGSGVTITAQLADASGTAINTSGKVVTWSSANGGSFSSPTSTTDANGQATVTFTTSNVAGTVHTVSATDAGSLTGTTGNITTVAGSATKLQVLLPGETAAPGTTTGKTGTPTSVSASSAVAATVNAVDANWNVVSTTTPTVAITSTDGSAVLPANAALVAGTKSFSVTLKTAGSQTITATDQAVSGALTSSTSASITVNVGAASPATSTVTVGASSLTTSGTTTITVTVKDAGGNVITNATSSAFALSASGGTVGTVSCANGVCTATYTAPSSAGTPSITATIGGTNIVNSPVAITVTAAPPSATNSTLGVGATSLSGGGTTTVTVTLKDASGATATSAGSGAFTLSADIGTLGTVSCTSGVCTSTYTAPTSNNTATITAQISGTNISGSPASITVTVAGTPGAPTSPAVSFNQTDTTANSQQANFTWVAPSSNGGSAITDYLIQYQVSGSGSWTTFSHTASTATAATITGLLNSTTYNFRAAAINSAGTGVFSATASGTTTGPSIRYECRVNGNSNSSGSSASVVPCSGVKIGDIIVVPLSIANNGTALTITSADGFTALSTVQNSLVTNHEFQTTIFYKVVTAADTGRTTAYGFSWTGNFKSVITLVAYKNVDGTAPLMTSATGSTATVTAPSAPSVSASGYTLLYFFTQNQSLSSTTPSISEWGLTTGTTSTTDLFKNTTAGSNNNNSLGVLTTDIDKFTAGQTTTVENAVVTAKNAAAAWNAVVLAIHP